MKIFLSDEEMNSLPQLDRIEFRQKRDELRKRYSSYAMILILIYFYTFAFLWLLGSILIWDISHSAFLMIVMMRLAIVGFKLLLLFFVFAFIYEIAIAFKARKAWRELLGVYKNKIYRRPAHRRKVRR